MAVTAKAGQSCIATITGFDSKLQQVAPVTGGDAVSADPTIVKLEPVLDPTTNQPVPNQVKITTLKDGGPIDLTFTALNSAGIKLSFVEQWTVADTQPQAVADSLNVAYSAFTPVATS